jgi:hypothetical protein
MFAPSEFFLLSRQKEGSDFFPVQIIPLRTSFPLAGLLRRWSASHKRK